MSFRVIGYRDGHRIIDDEGPNTAHAAQHHFSVHAENVGQMKPTVTSGGLSIDWHGPKRKAMTVVGKKP